jgi:hypothetical protein
MGAQTIYFAADGTWTCPAEVNRVAVELWGGGGGGGGGKSGAFKYGGGGGAGGQYSSKYADVIAATVYIITVGVGGTANTTTDGGDGSATIFAKSGASLVSALGGVGGTKYDNGATGGIATSTGGLYDICYAGGNGADGTTIYSGGGGGGAGSLGTGNSAMTTVGGTARGLNGGTGGAGTNANSGNGANGMHSSGGGGAATAAGMPGTGSNGYAKITSNSTLYYSTTNANITTLTDSLSISYPHTSRTLSQTNSLSDTLTIGLRIKRILSESMIKTMTNGIGNKSSRDVSQSLVATATLNRKIKAKRSRSESNVLTGTLKRKIKINRSRSESNTLTDTVNKKVSHQKLLSETLSLADTNITSIMSSQSPSTTVFITDSVDHHLRIERILEETVTLEDICNKISGLAADISNPTTLTDTIYSHLYAQRTFSNSISLTSTTTNLDNFNKFIGDSSILTDTLRRSLRVARTLICSLPLTASVAGSAGKRVTTILAENLVESTGFTRKTHISLTLHDTWIHTEFPVFGSQYFRYPSDEFILTDTQNRWLNKKQKLSDTLALTPTLDMRAPKWTKLIYESNIITETSIRGPSIFHRTLQETLTIPNTYIGKPLITSVDVYGEMAISRRGSAKFSLS